MKREQREKKDRGEISQLFTVVLLTAVVLYPTLVPVCAVSGFPSAGTQ